MINWKVLQKDSIIDVWQISKCTYGILWNSHSSHLLKAFSIKIAGCVHTTLLWELSHRRFFGNSPIFFKKATFQDFGWLLQISPEIIVMSLISLFNFCYEVRLCHKFCTCFLASFDEKFSHVLEITKFWYQDHVFTWNKFDKICGIIFRRCLYLSELKKSPKNCLTLLLIKP